MKNYIIEWFPDREFKGVNFCVKRSKGFYFFGFGWVIISLMIGLLPFFGIGVFSFATLFNILVNIPLLCYYFWLLLKIKKNVMGNGVPIKW